MSTEFSMENRVVLVTGGGRGIGRGALAKYASKQPHHPARLDTHILPTITAHGGRLGASKNHVQIAAAAPVSDRPAPRTVPTTCRGDLSYCWRLRKTPAPQDAAREGRN